ncbi:hypothetical protein ACFQY3_00185 [Paenibacillus farraposensis]|uniref:hypothetical protein n=1 Tax=Paenibacillus farraposensis TaxID=2807095 RepID=UPI001E32F93C|nr:hypothetical protein [Paenibacillus farraposensis]
MLLPDKERDYDYPMAAVENGRANGKKAEYLKEIIKSRGIVLEYNELVEHL